VNRNVPFLVAISREAANQIARGYQWGGAEANGYHKKQTSRGVMLKVFRLNLDADLAIKKIASEIGNK